MGIKRTNNQRIFFGILFLIAIIICISAIPVSLSQASNYVWETLDDYEVFIPLVMNKSPTSNGVWGNNG
jgi:hypothetical protein